MRLSALALVFLTVPAAAQGKVLVVSPTSTYKTVKSAVDAARTGDTVYVVKGTYWERFEVRGKSISLLCEPGTIVTSRSTPVVTIHDSGSSVPCTIRGLTTDLLALTECKQPVVLESCTFTEHILLLRCQSVLLAKCTGEIRSTDSWASAYDCSFRSTGRGASGLLQLGGYLFASNCGFVGSYGAPDQLIGTPPFTYCNGGAPGGNGATLDSGARLQHLGCTFQPGRGFDPVYPCTGKRHDGVALYLYRGSIATRISGSPRQLQTNGPVRETETWTVSVDTASGDLLWLVLNAVGPNTTLPTCHGTLAGSLNGAVLVAIGTTAGPIKIPLTVPELGPGVDILRFSVQAVVFDAGKQCVIGSPALAELLDRRF